MPRRRLRSALTALILLGSATTLLAQATPAPLLPDRPGFTETTRVVGPGVVQVEMGASLEIDGHGDARSRILTAPLGLVRVGLTRRIELRVGDDGEVVQAIGRGPGHTTTVGGTDVEVGLKWTVLDRPSAGFALAFIPLLSVPLGSETTSSGSYDPTVELAWSQSLARGFELGGNVNLSRLRDRDGRYQQEAVSLALSHGLGRAWEGYGEAYGLMDLGHHRAQAWSVDAGVSHTVGPHLALDVEVGRAVSRAAPDWFVGIGMGVRARPPRRAAAAPVTRSTPARSGRPRRG